jgi:hypothetical protein
LQDGWVDIYTADSQYKAELIVGLLSENGIEAIMLNQQDSVYLIGEIKIYVHRDNVVLAKHILENTEL